MELNILNSKLNVDANLHHDKTEQEFWYLYCQLLNLKKPILSDKDCNILSYILTLNYDNELSILEKENGKLLESATKTPLSNLYLKCKQLAEKGLLVKDDSGYRVHPKFVSLQRHIKTGDREIKFTVPIKIVRHGIISS